VTASSPRRTLIRAHDSTSAGSISGQRRRSLGPAVWSGRCWDVRRSVRRDCRRGAALLRCWRSRRRLNFEQGVQIRIAGPAVPMGERRRHQTANVDLPMHCAPVRVNNACPSMNRSASRTAAWWACSITAATVGGATAHGVDTDFTGEKVRSKPATVSVRGGELLAICPATSRASTGSRPCSARTPALLRCGPSPGPPPAPRNLRADRPPH
jgi:hypothetical protein